MVTSSESRHASLGELVTKEGIGDASGRKDPVRSAVQPVTVTKFILLIFRGKSRTVSDFDVLGFDEALAVNHLHTFIARGCFIYITAVFL